MGDLNQIRFTGGVFFSLLSEIKYEAGTSEYVNPFHESVSDPMLMSELINVITGTCPKTNAGGFSKDVSKYRTCLFCGGKNVPFNEPAFTTAFRSDIRNDYAKLLKRITDFCSRCLNPLEITKHETFVKQVLRLIEMDETISDNHLLYISVDGSTTKKDDALKLESFNFDAFLLGVFYLIIELNDNTDGKKTYDLLFPAAESHTKGIFKPDALGDLSHKINISYTEPEDSFRPESFSEEDENSQTSIPEEVMDEFSKLSYAAKRRISFNLSTQMPNADDVTEYLEKAQKYYSSIKTLLYAENPRLFSEFYVCNNLEKKAHGLGTRNEAITGVTIAKIGKISSYCIISGTGGIGKSMMMRHLFFDAASKYEDTGFLPVLVSLKDYNPDANSLVDFLFESIKEFNEAFSLATLRQFLNAGKCILLLDGLDEIPIAQKDGFEGALKKFIKQYEGNQVIISSRPFNSFVQYTHFTILEILPFTKQQSLLLIDKLEFHDPVAKGKFRNDLEHSLYKSHKEFASNPLLLTIMLMTYSTYGEIPAKRHVFYSKAYETMSRLHDASKGAYVRPMQTGLSPEEFELYFSDFCARTYAAEVIEFSAQSFATYMDKVIEHQRTKGRKTDATSADFLDDLTNNLCLMYKEGESYFFFHRSFQEYFCALHFSKIMDVDLPRVGKFFESQKKRQAGDLTFDMLYDMKSEAIDRYVFLPFLKEQYQHYDSTGGYWTFLFEMYSVLYSAAGEGDQYFGNEADSFLFNFIVNHTGINTDLYGINWPGDIADFEEEQWYEYTDYDPGDYENPPSSQTYVVTFDELPDRYKYDIDGFDYEEPTLVGATWEIEIDTIINNHTKYNEIIAFMENDDFPMKKVYDKVRIIMNNMDKHFAANPSSDDWFDTI